MIPRSHPRYESLRIREILVSGFESGAVAAEGMLAHGRGEAFDYLIGEKTGPAAATAIRAAAAAIMLSSRSIISVNGNMAALCSRDIASISKISKSPVEINLFYDNPRRRRVIAGIMQRAGSERIYGVGGDATAALPGIESNRRHACVQGILSADTVLVAIEDGDHAEALQRAGKRVIAIDLNPFSRTSQTADITIVDNIVRATPLLIRYCAQMTAYHQEPLRTILDSFDNKYNLDQSIMQIQQYVESQRIA